MHRPIVAEQVRVADARIGAVQQDMFGAIQRAVAALTAYSSVVKLFTLSEYLSSAAPCKALVASVSFVPMPSHALWFMQPTDGARCQGYSPDKLAAFLAETERTRSSIAAVSRVLIPGLPQDGNTGEFSDAKSDSSLAALSNVARAEKERQLQGFSDIQQLCNAARASFTIEPKRASSNKGKPKLAASASVQPDDIKVPASAASVLWARAFSVSIVGAVVDMCDLVRKRAAWAEDGASSINDVGSLLDSALSKFCRVSTATSLTAMLSILEGTVVLSTTFSSLVSVGVPNSSSVPPPHASFKAFPTPQLPAPLFSVLQTLASCAAVNDCISLLRGLLSMLQLPLWVGSGLSVDQPLEPSLPWQAQLNALVQSRVQLLLQDDDRYV